MPNLPPSTTEESKERGLLLKRQRNQINHQNLPGQEHARWFPIQQRGPKKAHRAAIVHGRAREVEWEACDRLIHQDTEVIAKICADDAKGPGARQDEDISCGKEGVCEER